MFIVILLKDQHRGMEKTQRTWGKECGQAGFVAFTSFIRPGLEE
jgi:hypothetical protein